MTKLTDITNLIIDMDGVLYRGDEPVAGLHDFFAFMRGQPIPFILATNNSTRTQQQYVEKMAGLGVQILPKEVLTSGLTVARVLAHEYPAGTRVHVFGMLSLKQAIADQGFHLVDEAPDIVVASLDRDITYNKCKRAALFILGGARFVATNLDPNVPTSEGLLPGTGSMIALLETATGVKPTAVGKPEAAMFEIAMELMGAKPETTAMIGDRLDTDILGAQRAGLTSILVLSGSSSREEAEAYQPDFIFEDIAELLQVWQSQL